MQKSKKFVLLATYAVAVICLLAGLFLPLFEGKSLLALQLPDVFKSLLNKGLGEGAKYDAIAFPIQFFGMGKKIDFMAVIIVLYLAVTGLSLLAAAPVILSVRKEGKLAVKLCYAFEISAVTVLSLYLVIALQFYPEFPVHYNMIVALGGSFVSLLLLCCMDKGKSGIVRIVLFLLSAVAFLSLFNFVILLDKEEAYVSVYEKIKLGSGYIENDNGAGYLTLLFAKKISDLFKEGVSVKDRALIMLAALTATVVLINYFIDAVRLGTGRDKKFGRIFYISRYGLGLALAVCVLATTFICKSRIGIMLIILLVAVAIQLTISVIRIVSSAIKKKANAVSEQEAEDADEITIWKEPEPAKLTATAGATVEEFEEIPEAEIIEEEIDLTPPFDDLPEETFTEPAEEEKTEFTAEAETVEEVKAEDEILPEELHEELYTEPTADFKNEPVYIEPDVMPEDPYKDDTVYVEKPVEEADEPEEIAEEKTETAETVEKLAGTEEEILPENVPEEDDEDDETEEPAEEAPVAEEVEEETHEEPEKQPAEPYNPYMHRDNPFRAYEHNSQTEPYNPYTQRKPSNPFEKTYTSYEPKPVEPKPVEKPVEQKPVHQEYKPREPIADKRPPVKPLQPRPIIQEFKPVPPVSEQPPKDPHIYTIDTIYAGPMDDFIRKLSNDERIEFAKTFIEKNRGDLGNIPDYVVGGENKKFFNVAFIYLGRIRGLVSDGLLNKMYKELNML